MVGGTQIQLLTRDSRVVVVMFESSDSIVDVAAGEGANDLV